MKEPYWRTSWPNETDHILTAGTTKLLIVAFSSCGDEDWAAPPFQWLPTCERAVSGAHLLQVRDLRRQWYLPHAPFAALVDAALASSGASAVLYVGASMGGFAALTALAAASPHRPPARAVVFSPQVAMSRAARERLGDERWYVLHLSTATPAHHPPPPPQGTVRQLPAAAAGRRRSGPRPQQHGRRAGGRARRQRVRRRRRARPPASRSCRGGARCLRQRAAHARTTPPRVRRARRDRVSSGRARPGRGSC